MNEYQKGFADGIKAHKEMILNELRNIGAQTEDPTIFSLVRYFEKLGENEVSR